MEDRWLELAFAGLLAALAGSFCQRRGARGVGAAGGALLAAAVAHALSGALAWSAAAAALGAGLAFLGPFALGAPSARVGAGFERDASSAGFGGGSPPGCFLERGEP